MDGLLTEVTGALPRSPGDRYDQAEQVLRQVALTDEYPTFLTLGAYAQHLVHRAADG